MFSGSSPLIDEGYFTGDLAEFLLKMKDLEFDVIARYLYDQDVDYRTVVAMVKCGLRFDMFLMRSEHCDEIFPFIRGAFLEGPEQGRSLNQDFNDWFPWSKPCRTAENPGRLCTYSEA